MTQRGIAFEDENPTGMPPTEIKCRKREKTSRQGKGRTKREMKQSLGITAGVITAALSREWLACMPCGMLSEKLQRL